MSIIARHASNVALVRDESSLSSHSTNNGPMPQKNFSPIASPFRPSKQYSPYDNEQQTPRILVSKGSSDMIPSPSRAPNAPYAKRVPSSINTSRGLILPDHHQTHIQGSNRPTRSLSRENVGGKLKSSTGIHTRHKSTSNVGADEISVKDYRMNGRTKSSEDMADPMEAMNEMESTANRANNFGRVRHNGISPPANYSGPNLNGTPFVAVNRQDETEGRENYKPGLRQKTAEVTAKVSHALQHIDPRTMGQQLRNPNTSYHHMHEERDDAGDRHAKYAKSNLAAEIDSPVHVAEPKSSYYNQKPHQVMKHVNEESVSPYQSHSLSYNNRQQQRQPVSSNMTSMTPHYQHSEQSITPQVAYLPQQAMNQNKRTVYQTAPDRFNSAPHLISTRPNGVSGRDAPGQSSFCGSISSMYNLPKGSTVSFHGISYVVKSKRWPWSDPERKTILNNVSGYMKPGMNAIMGPTGSGKSSLLDVLAGRKNPKYLDGDVLVDGRPQPPNFKCISGYVVQDDIVMGTLTVKENLRFSAALRLPQEVPAEARDKAVIRVMEELGLSHIANSKIGTELIRGVSGGERKRTNIGIELITDPSVLFLDEPTTGLDAFTAYSVIKTLRNLSLRGRTIIFSIHQPKYSIYKLFDTLTLVCRGELVYHGTGDRHPLIYFESLGYKCEEHNNPPDFFLDILNEEVKTTSTKMIAQDAYVGRNRKRSMDEVIIRLEEEKKVTSRLISCWRESREARNVGRVVNDIYSRYESTQGDKEISIKKGVEISYRATFLTQMLYVSWRTALNLVRNPQASIIQLGVYLFFALSVGAVYTPLNQSQSSGIQNRMGLFFFTTLQMVFVNLGAVEVFIKERQIFIHETSSGFYRTSAYFIAKIFCDMLPIKALPVVIFMPITYWMVGLKREAGPFFFFELVLLLTTMSACGIAFFVSASVSVFGIANIFISITYVFMMVFGGYLINLQSMGVWISWCQHLSIFRYSISALAVNEFVNMEFTDTTNTTLVSKSKGETYLDTQNIAHDTAWDQWRNILGLTLITIFFCALCYVQLRRIKRYK